MQNILNRCSAGNLIHRSQRAVKIEKQHFTRDPGVDIPDLRRPWASDTVLHDAGSTGKNRAGSGGLVGRELPRRATLANEIGERQDLKPVSMQIPHDATRMSASVLGHISM